MSSEVFETINRGCQMGLIYTRSELAKEIHRSVETVKKIAIKRGLKETFKTINNREIVAYEVDTAVLNEIKEECGIETRFETSSESSETPYNTPYDIPQTPNIIVETMDRILEFSNEHNQRLETYIERALKAEQQQRLLEVSETSKDDEINRLNALVKELQMAVKTHEKEKAQLVQKLEAERKRPFWSRSIV